MCTRPFCIKCTRNSQGETIHNTNKYTYNNLYCIIRSAQDASTYYHNTIPEIHAYLSDTVRSSPHIALSSMFQLTQKQQVALCGADWQSVLLPLLLPCGTCHPCCCPTTQHKARLQPARPSCKLTRGERLDDTFPRHRRALTRGTSKRRQRWARPAPRDRCQRGAGKPRRRQLRDGVGRETL